MISRSHEEGQLNQVESELIDNVFNFVERMAKEVYGASAKMWIVFSWKMVMMKP